MVIREGYVLCGRYEVRAALDTGTLADIRVAHDRILERKVCVKFPIPRRASASERLDVLAEADLFRSEARLAAELQHPHLLPVYDFGSDPKTDFLVMRYFDETLRHHMRRLHGDHPMPIEAVISLFRQVGSAVDYLHEKLRIPHGNLKPDNIVLDSELGSQVHPFVSDFGVAARGAARAGTPLYMAPEQLTDEHISTAADIYSLGVVLFECLTGRTPFEDETAAATLTKKLSAPDAMYSVRALRPELPTAIDNVIAGFTRRIPEERFRSASLGVEELARAIVAGRPTVGGTVFVSYARADAAYAQELSRRLRSAGVDLWSDQDIEPGQHWDEHVETALHQATKMLLVLSPAAIASQNVRDEWRYFLGKGKPVYPYVYQACDVPFGLQRRQFTQSTGDVLIDVSRLIEALSQD